LYLRLHPAPCIRRQSYRRPSLAGIPLLPFPARGDTC
jgi:hypothetical protein